jgi:pimeloyl-ACP methyl ester carboxylesterase
MIPARRVTLRIALLCLWTAAVVVAARATVRRPAPTTAVAPKPGPTVILVHGAFGGSWAFKDVAARLSADGYTVYRPSLTGQGERVHLATPQVDLATHITDVVNEIRFEDLHDVVLVGHSYGGMVITGVVQQVPDRIAKVIYLDAFLPLDGESGVQEITHLQHRTGPTKPDATGYLRATWVSATQPLPHDVNQPGATFTQPIHLRGTPATAGKPTTYVLYVPPKKRPADAKFYYFYQRAQSFGWPVTTLESDHNAQWTHPAELTRMIESIAGR